MRKIATQYPGKCRQCGKAHNVGDSVYWNKGTRGVLCTECGESKTRPPAPDSPRNIDMDRNFPIPVLQPSEKPSEITGTAITPTFRTDTNENGENVNVATLEWSDLKTQARQQFNSGVAPPFNAHNKDRWNAEAIQTRNDKWRGYKATDVQRWLDRGFQLPGLQFDNPPIPIREKRRFRLDENGEEFLADMLYSGEDIFTADYTKREVIPGMALEIGVHFSSNVDEKILKEYFSFVCRALYALEMSGVDLQVVLTNPLRAVDYNHPTLAGICNTHVRVKREGEASDFNSWSAMLSPASLRTFMFLATFNHADALGGKVRHGIGTPVATPWQVKFDPENRVIVINPDSRGTRSFPEQEMTEMLAAAIAASH